MGDSGTTMAMVQRMQTHTDHRAPWIAAWTLDFWLHAGGDWLSWLSWWCGGQKWNNDFHFRFRFTSIFCSKGEEQQDGCCLSDTYPTYDICVFFLNETGFDLTCNRRNNWSSQDRRSPNVWLIHSPFLPHISGALCGSMPWWKSRGSWDVWKQPSLQ